MKFATIVHLRFEWLRTEGSRGSGKRTRLACWFRRRAETVFPLNVNRRADSKVYKSSRSRDALARHARRVRYPTDRRSPIPTTLLIARLVCDCTELFDERCAFLAIVDHERVVFSKSGPRAARHFLKIHKAPVGHVRFF